MATGARGRVGLAAGKLRAVERLAASGGERGEGGVGAAGGVGVAAGQRRRRGGQGGVAGKAEGEGKQQRGGNSVHGRAPARRFDSGSGGAVRAVRVRR